MKLPKQEVSDIKAALESNSHALLDLLQNSISDTFDRDVAALLSERDHLIRSIPVSIATADYLKQLLQENARLRASYLEKKHSLTKKLQYTQTSKSALKKYKGISRSE
ncbi:hypothetical protein FJM67_02330 [Maribrevibacterium harenarium]|uniref:Uncharacterized protein n=1 Tax=Maribrevibacterium harenarium TaxID=2589817 RepID=A0A501X389_9GAMM|nr:hypothetical protein [Maribrevibacterium harenarium]TPE54913.1 hypothetical protein FJM67_02330 [Maribrevibacterium harenarium]